MGVTRTGPGVATVEAALKGLEGLQAKTGWFESANYIDEKGRVTPVAYVATIHEFGTDRIPARPFMRPAVADHGREWIDKLGAGAKDVLNGHATGEGVLDLVANLAAANVAEKIRAVTSPPLSEATVKRKGFAKPLVESGQMEQSVTGRVERS